jgi:hypothetical protein
MNGPGGGWLAADGSPLWQASGRTMPDAIRLSRQ